MTVRSVIKRAPWRFHGETGEGSPDAIFTIECMTCHEESEPVDNDGRVPQEWAMQHTGRNTDHRLFKLHTETYWRVDPASGNPLCEEDGCPTP
ncbi:DUF7848 domain-containing protein [Actinacidiphila oryziradicis]